MAFVSSFPSHYKLMHQAYSEIGWGVPFAWAAIWAGISVVWVRRDLHREAEEWELDCSMLSGKKEPELEPKESEKEPV